MPGDTKVRRTPNGWVDTDDPNKYYTVRRLARDARRSKTTTTTATTKTTKSRMKTVIVTGLKHTATNISAGQQILTRLQTKLLKRLTNSQGVSEVDAVEVIVANGYNKSASYGHMRAAGATDSEAKIVIRLGNPKVSVIYGKARARGLNHTQALSEALKCQVND